MDAITVAEQIIDRAYRRRMRRDTLIRVGLWYVLPWALWGVAIVTFWWLAVQVSRIIPV